MYCAQNTLVNRPYPLFERLISSNAMADKAVNHHVIPRIIVSTRDGPTHPEATRPAGPATLVEELRDPNCRADA